MTSQLQISSQLSILVISDTGTVRDILSQGLKSLGLKEIDFQNDGMAALKHLRQNQKVEVVICERDLPNISGLEVLRELGESDDIETGSFVLVSSGISKADVAMAAELGCDAYLLKPFALRDLALKVTQAVARATDPNCLDTRIRAAKNIMVRGDTKSALSVCMDIRKWLGASVTSARLAVVIGRCHLKLGQNDKALAEFDAAVKANPMYVHAFQERGLCHLEAGRNDQAIADFDAAINLSPNNPVRYEMIAELLFNAQNFETAESYLMRAIKLELAYPDLFAQLGKTLFAQKKPERAAQFFGKALLRDPKNTSFLNSLGICYRELGRVDSALEKYNLALKINPADVKVLFNKALCLISLGDFDRAQKTLELVLRHDPSYTKAATKLTELPKLKAAMTSSKKAS
jgi:Flp pilus assembly protein TadD